MASMATGFDFMGLEKGIEIKATRDEKCDQKLRLEGGEVMTTTVTEFY